MVSPLGGVNSGKGCPAALAMFFISMTRPPSAIPKLWRKNSSELHKKSCSEWTYSEQTFFLYYQTVVCTYSLFK